MNVKKTVTAVTTQPWSLVLITLLVLGIIIIVGNQSFRAIETVTFSEFNQRQLVMAREASRGIVLYFDTLTGALKTMAGEPEVLGFDEAATRRIVAFEMDELENLGVDNIGVVDANGVLRFTATAHEMEGADVSREPYFQKAKQTTPAMDTYLTQLTEAKESESDQQAILVVVPMFGDPANSFAGVIFCALKLEILTQKFAASVKASERGHAFLIDDTYRVLGGVDRTLYGKDLWNRAAEFPSFQHILEKMITGDTGTGEYDFEKFDNAATKFVKGKEANLIAYSPVQVGQENWSLGVWAPKADAKKLIHSAYVKQLLLVGLIILATFLGSGYTIAMVFRYNRTLEKEVEAKAKEFMDSHHRLLTVLESLDAAVTVVDLETHEILFVNKYTRDLFGSVVGKTCWQVLHPDQSGPCGICTKKDLFKPDGSPGGVCVREFQTGDPQKWYQARDRAIQWVDGRMVKLEIATDVTDRKLAEEELRRAYHETGTFCRIIKQIGIQQALDGVGSFLVKELQGILKVKYLMLLVFNSDMSTLYTLSENGTASVKNQDQIQAARTLLESLEGVTLSSQKTFPSPLLPADFPARGQQVIIPLKGPGQIEGAFVAMCSQDSHCDEKRLEMVNLILEQASGTIKRAVLHEEEIHALQSRIESSPEYLGIIGRDPKMQAIYRMIEDIAPTDATVMIQGESGTGKELVARALHRQSLRKDKPFIVINCSAYPATLLESELFGHEKGAFTGALRQKAGRFEQAHGGTVFLDEIGEIPHSAQIKLLRVLQTQKFERLGGEQTVSVDLRILAATNRDLIQEVQNGNFREDLFYRLNVIPVTMPPLRLRRNDIPLLARHFLERFALEQGKEVYDFSSEAMRRLLDYHWPGNVRELENSIEHAAVLAKGNRIEVSHLPSGLLDIQAPDSLTAHGTILENEKRLLVDVLEECNWNKSKAAQHLGISRSTLYDKLKKFQVSKPPAN